LLLPVFSAFGFIAMGRELSTSPAVAAIAMDRLSPTYAAQQIAMAQWRNTLLIGYFSIIGATFAARAVRNAIEHGRRRVILISYPGRTVRVPRGWSVLEASRSFHIPHASMCGGRARCSTCRVQVTAGEDECPAAELQERATLDRIGAPPDVRLACQLRPEANISVIPLVRTERAIYRLPPPQRSPEREIVVMFCDFLNRAELAGDHMPQDLLYLLMRYLEAISNAIRLVDGTLSSVRPDSVCALFGLECGLAQAAHQALRAAAAIERAVADLNDKLGRQGESRVKVAISIHAGAAVVGEIGASDPPMVMALGEALDVVNEVRKAAAAQGKPFAITKPVYTAAGLDQSCESEVTVPGFEVPVAMSLSESAPALPVSTTSFRERRAAFQRLWNR
jgi:adenylate cyclase